MAWVDLSHKGFDTLKTDQALLIFIFGCHRERPGFDGQVPATAVTAAIVTPIITIILDTHLSLSLSLSLLSMSLCRRIILLSVQVVKFK